MFVHDEILVSFSVLCKNLNFSYIFNFIIGYKRLLTIKTVFFFKDLTNNMNIPEIQ